MFLTITQVSSKVYVSMVCKITFLFQQTKGSALNGLLGVHVIATLNEELEQSNAPMPKILLKL